MFIDGTCCTNMVTGYPLCLGIPLDDIKLLCFAESSDSWLCSKAKAEQFFNLAPTDLFETVLSLAIQLGDGH